jgi:isoamylase
MSEAMYEIEPGRAHPLGATPDRAGVNFSIFSQHATDVELLLFARRDDRKPLQIIRLDPLHHRTFHFWHVYVRSLKPGMHYAYRFDGPHSDIHRTGDRFNPSKVILDPYAREVSASLWCRADAIGPGDNVATSLRGTVVDASAYDWRGDHPLCRPMSQTIIYELHVAGFTKSPTSDCRFPGTFAGIVEKIPYLQELGITAVELLPIFAFDEHSLGRRGPDDGQPLTNVWGYDPLAHFAPHPAYCRSQEEGCQLRDFRDMVRELHAAGIEVILDVVFNHTGEGGPLGPTISFKGIDNSVYYDLDPNDRQRYVDYTGCGNTFKCNHPIVGKLIGECLEYWVKEMHVDGFRFDEASIFSRAGDGKPLKYPPIIWHLELDTLLADTKFIVEAWDAGGLYQVGSFPGYRWAEWNGRFRDDFRRFIRGDRGTAGAVASRLGGSADLYQATGHMPINSVNFITCHDGFTLNDLVSYNQKHNEANGEGNRDGSDCSWSWNCGAEGDARDPTIEALRLRQIKNFLAVLLLAQGVPMILAGDEVRRSQRGNNNAYCQDNEISWFDWTLPEQNADLLRFFKRMVAFRTSHPVLHREQFFTGQSDVTGKADIEWHGRRLFTPAWHDPDGRVLAFSIWGSPQDDDLHVMLNMEVDAVEFEVPPLEGQRWHKVIDTAATSPRDIMDTLKAPIVRGSACPVESHSIVVLVAR